MRIQRKTSEWTCYAHLSNVNDGKVFGNLNSIELNDNPVGLDSNEYITIDHTLNTN